MPVDRPAAQAGVPEGGLGERIRRAADALEARAAEANDLRERCFEVQRILWGDNGTDLGCRTAWREALLRTPTDEKLDAEAELAQLRGQRSVASMINESLRSELREAESALYRLRGAAPELADALAELLRAYESILPGVKYIAVQDYAVLNDAPIAARSALAKAGR